MNAHTFTQLVFDALDSLPEEFSRKLNNVDIVIEDYPTMYQRQKKQLRHPFALFGLYEGVPQNKRTSNYSLIPPDKITIFRLPILAFSQNIEEVKTNVSKTVLHEIGHHFGLTDKQLRSINY